MRKRERGFGCAKTKRVEFEGDSSYFLCVSEKYGARQSLKIQSEK